MSPWKKDRTRAIWLGHGRGRYEGADTGKAGSRGHQDDHVVIQQSIVSHSSFHSSLERRMHEGINGRVTTCFSCFHVFLASLVFRSLLRSFSRIVKTHLIRSIPSSNCAQVFNRTRHVPFFFFQRLSLVSYKNREIPKDCRRESNSCVADK